MRLQQSILLLLVGTVLGISPVLHAEDQPTSQPSAEQLNQAQTLLSEANAHYAAKRYDEARAAYQAAYELTEAPGFLYNIAQSHRLAGQCREAIEFYEKFLSLDSKTSLRSKVEGFVAEMWTCLDAEKKAQQEAGARQSADAGKERPSPGMDIPSNAAASPEGQSRLPLVGVAIAATGVLVLGTSAYFGLSARSTSQEIESFTGTWGPAQESDEKQAQRHERFAIILGVGASAALAGGIATYLLYRKPGSGGLALLPAPGGALLSYSSSL